MIAALLIEPLGIAIGRLFPPPTLNFVMLKVTGDDLYQWVPRGLNDRETALALIAVVSRRDMELIVLAELLVRQPTDQTFGKLIDDACPGARLQVPSVGDSVRQVVTGIDAIMPRLGDPATRQAVESSQARLAEIAERTESLHIYKNLHEFLHMLQVGQFRALRDAARKLPDSSDQVDILLAYRGQLGSVCLSARTAVRELADASRKQAELDWIDALDQAGDRFHDAIDLFDTRSAQVALRDIRRVMRSAPSRLNDLIAATAKVLPLDELEKALSIIAEQSGDPAIQAALSALRLIIPTVRARVNEHKSWQDVDVRISDLDQLIEQQPRDLVEEFGDAWFEVKNLVQALMDQDPNGEWTPRLERYSANLSDQLAEVERVTGKPLDTESERLAKEKVEKAFADTFAKFRRDAQFRFLSVDSDLKTDCGALVGLGRPVREMLAAL